MPVINVLEGIEVRYIPYMEIGEIKQVFLEILKYDFRFSLVYLIYTMII